MRVDSGVREGSVIGGQFDSMLAKLIVTGETRQQALERSRRALDEFVVEGMPTVLPFDRAIVRDPAFIGDGESFDVYTRWIEEEWKNELEPFVDPDDVAEDDSEPKQKFVVEVAGRRIEVALPSNLSFGGLSPKKKSKKRRSKGGAGAGVSGDAVAAPMQGTVIKVSVEEGQEVAEGDVVVILEAMKMENPVKAHKSGVVTGLDVEEGKQVNKNDVLFEIK